MQANLPPNDLLRQDINQGVQNLIECLDRMKQTLGTLNTKIETNPLTALQLTEWLEQESTRLIPNLKAIHDAVSDTMLSKVSVTTAQSEVT